ncbi:MAG: L,D-transpeptidase/peptidoglycan binding protein [Lachnospiraceae bacterium]|nr:L,D-transpeptidase/peptidoglycan binding protein [Lachnospiraceae bacterium]
MRTKISGFFLKIILISFIALAALYFLAAFRYWHGFQYGTRINGLNCAGMSITEVSQKLSSESLTKDLTVTFPDGSWYVIKAEDISFSKNYDFALSMISDSQNTENNPLLWGKKLFSSANDWDFDPIISFDEEKLKETLSGCDFVKNNADPGDVVVEIVKVDGVYSLLNTARTYIDFTKVCDYVCESLKSGKVDITVPDSVYIEPVLTDGDLATLDLWKDIEAFIEPKLVYDMGDENIVLDSAFLSSLLTFENGLRDRDGKILFDKEKLISFIDKVCDTYDTSEGARTFTSINGEVKTLEKNYYGTLIDKQAEEEYIVRAVADNVKETHIPKYIKEAYHRGINDIGPTRIEIDLTRQKLYYIKDGKVDVESDVVTGNPNTLHATGEMVTSVQKLSKDTYLRGEGYRSFVKYWIAVYKNTIGIHDASWQKAFGGNRYLTHGSKGCINVPEDVARDLYSKVDVGMPVLIYK